MGVFSSIYPNLPGMLVEFKDGGMSLREDTTTTSSTDSILLLGTAVDGPVNEPVAVSDSTVEALFGSAVNANGVSNGSTLVRAYKQARKRGCTDVRLMRVTGAQATNEIYCTTKNESQFSSVEEAFTTIKGNAETVINLSRGNIEADSVEVYVKGIVLLNGYSVDATRGVVTIEEGVCKAGATVTVKYKYAQLLSITNEKAIVNVDSKIVLAQEPVGKISVLFNGSPISDSNYTISGKEVTFDSGANLNEDDEVSVSYSYYAKDLADATESGSAGVPFVTATYVTAGQLAHLPVRNSVILYVNGVRHTDQTALSVTHATGEIRVDVKNFEISDVLTVKYKTETVKEIKPLLKLSSYFGGSVYNEGCVDVVDLLDDNSNVIGKRLVITKPSSKKSSLESPLYYDSTVYPTLELLVEAINNDSNNGIYKASTDFGDTATYELLCATQYFSGGEDGVKLSKQELFNALSGTRDANGYLEKAGAYQLLEDYQVDWVVPLGCYADDELDDEINNFAYELGLFCAILSYRNKTTLGAIAMAPNKDTSLSGVQAYAKNLVKFNNRFYLHDLNGQIITDSEGNATDLGMFLSIVAGPEIKVTDASVGSFYGNPAVDYVAMNTVLEPQSAPTNKAISGAKALRFTFSNAQLDTITGNRMVSFKNKYNSSGVATGIAVVDGVTAAQENSDYTRVTTQKTIKYAVNQIREVCEPYIGESNTVEQRNAMSAAISKRLSIIKEKGIIQDSSFQVISTAQDALLGNAQVELVIVPPQELRRITTVVGLSASI